MLASHLRVFMSVVTEVIDLVMNDHVQIAFIIMGCYILDGECGDGRHSG